MSNEQWSRDEYLVTLDLYLNRDDYIEDDSDPVIREMADLIGRSPGSVALRLANYRHLDPRSTEGMSNVGEEGREIWEEYYGNEEELASEAERARGRLLLEDETDDESGGRTEIETDTVVREGTTRRGQADFRYEMRDRYDDTCLLCDVSSPGLLQAGHILEWSEFEAERGDPANGLLLCYTHHRAFDLGMFTISEDHEVALRPGFTPEGEFLERTLVDGRVVEFPSESPAAEYLERHNERLPWGPPNDSDH